MCKKILSINSQINKKITFIKCMKKDKQINMPYIYLEINRDKS